MMEILDPTMGPVERKAVLAPRLEGLAGKTIGVIWNGRPTGDLILNSTIDILRARYDIKRVVFRAKPYMGNIAPDEILDEISASCDAAITGVGD